MSKVVIFGHSHVLSIRRALKDWSESEVNFEIALCGTKEFVGGLMYLNKHGNQKLSPLISSVLNRYAGKKEEKHTWFVSMAQGNYYNQLGMLAEERTFDFVLNGMSDLPLDTTATFLPVDAIKDALKEKMADFPAYLASMAKSAFGKRFIVVGPPPPNRDDNLVAELIEEEQDLVVNPYTVRLKLWRVQNELIQHYCEQKNVHFFRGDIEKTCDIDGFLLPEYVKDSVHANHLYGKRLLKELERYVLKGRQYEK